MRIPMRICIYVSSKSSESNRVEEFLRTRPGHGIPVVRIETKEAAARVRNSNYPISSVPTLLLVDDPPSGTGGDQRARMWVGYDKIIEFLTSSGPSGGGEGTRRPERDGPRPRVRVMDRPERDGPSRPDREPRRPVPRHSDDYPEDDPEDDYPEEEPEDDPPPPPRKRKTTVGTPKQRRAAAKRLTAIAEEEDPDEELTGRELAAKKAAAARRVRKPASKMDDVVALAKKQQAEARKSLPYKDKNFLA